MKIVILGSAHPLRGGLSSYNERLATEFVNMGHEVIIYTFSLQYPSFLFPGVSQYSDSPAPANLDIRVKVNSINPFNWIAVGQALGRLRPDLLVVKFWLPFMGPCFGTICRIVKRNRHTRIVSILDNVIPHEKRPGDIQFTKYFLACVDGFVAMSQSVETDLRKFVTNKLCLLNPHPLFDNFGTAVTKLEACTFLNINFNTPYILFFGFIRDYKGLDWLLQAMNHELIKPLPFKLIVAGEYYTDSEKYLTIIKELKLENRVILKTEFIRDEEVKYYFCAADMVVQPYKNATQSGVTQICYHFNKAMLVTNVGGLAEIVPHEKAGYVVEPDVDAIAEALHNFYTSHRQKEFETFVEHEKKKYAWSLMADKVVQAAGL